METLSVRSNIATKLAHHGEASSLIAGVALITLLASKRIPNRAAVSLTYIPKVKSCLSWLKCCLTHANFTGAVSVRRIPGEYRLWASVAYRKLISAARGLPRHRVCLR